MAESVLAGLRRNPIPAVVGGLHAESAGVTHTEAGIGAVVPWAGKLWFNTYPAENTLESRVGLWSMDTDLRVTKERESSVTSAARIIVKRRLFISWFVISSTGVISDITGFSPDMRPAGYAAFYGDNTYVWALSMKGEIWRITADPPYTATLVADNSALNLGSTQPHGKAIWASGGWLYFALNADGGGRLARYNPDTEVTELLAPDDWPWIEVSGSYDGQGGDSRLFYAVGHDLKSIRFWMFRSSGSPAKFRLPLPSRQQLDGWQHEWMRIRQVETERFLMDAYGGFYQLSIATSNRSSNGFPLVEPVSNHARTVTDFTSWNGYLVLASNQNTPQAGDPPKYPTAGQSDSGLLLTTTDALWSYGKPHGEGLWYDNEAVTAGAMSEPMLIRGYEKRSLFVSSSAATDVEVWVYHQHRPFLHSTLTMTAGGYDRLDLPAADWVAIKSVSTSTLTAGVVVGG